MKNKIVSDDESISLAELLNDYVKESFCIDKINFKLECFNLQHNEKFNFKELTKLAEHLRSKTSHKSAVGILYSQPNDEESEVGHAISMYDYDAKNKTFYYKDSSVKAYKFFESETAQPPSKGLPLKIQDCTILEKAWTFKAEYTGAA